MGGRVGGYTMQGVSGGLYNTGGQGSVGGVI